MESGDKKRDDYKLQGHPAKPKAKNNLSRTSVRDEQRNKIKCRKRE